MKRFLLLVPEHKALVYVLLLSLTIKILLLLQNPVINRDAVVYIAAAQNFSEGLFEEGSRHYQMPLYPLLLTAVHFVIPDWIWAGRLFNTLILLLCLFPLYFITLRLFDQKSALAASLLFAVLPVFNSPVNYIIRDPLFLLLSLCVLALLTYQKDKITISGMVGIVFMVVFATLIRIEGVLFFILIPLLIIWFCRNRSGPKVLLQFVCIAVLLIGLSVSVLWGLALSDFDTQSRFNEVFVWIKGLISLELFSGYAALYEQLKVFQESTPYPNLRNNLVETARHYIPLIYFIGLLEIIIKELFPTTLLAFAALRWGHRPLFNSERVIVVWPFLAFLVLNLLFTLVMNFSVTRYMWIPIVLILPFAGYGIGLWWQRFDHRRIVLAMLVLVFFAAPTTKTLGDLGKEHLDSIRQAGKWLITHDTEQRLNVFVNDRRLNIYSNRAQMHANSIEGVLIDGKIVDTFSTSGADLVVLYFTGKIAEPDPPEGYIVLNSFEDNVSSVFVLSRE